MDSGPALGLGPKLVRLVFELIVRLRDEEGVTILLVEQNVHQALACCDRAYLMRVGSVETEGTPEELVRDRRHLRGARPADVLPQADAARRLDPRRGRGLRGRAPDGRSGGAGRRLRVRALRAPRRDRLAPLLRLGRLGQPDERDTAGRGRLHRRRPRRPREPHRRRGRWLRAGLRRPDPGRRALEHDPPVPRRGRARDPDRDPPPAPAGARRPPRGDRLMWWPLRSAAGAAVVAGALSLVAAWGWSRGGDHSKLTHFFVNVTIVVALFAWWIGTISPTDFFLAPTFALIVMFIVGGKRTVAGAVVGAALVTLVQEQVRGYEDSSVHLGLFTIHRLTGLTQMVLVVMILIVMYLRPEGIVGREEPDEAVARFLRRRPA